MKVLFLMSRTSIRLGLVSFIVGSVLLLPCSDSKIRASAGKGPEPRQKTILEVINRHFALGRKIPSVYLRVFSNGTAECDTEKYTKKKVLSSEEFEELKAIIDEPELLDVKKRYELMHMVVDSWMEWDISIKHPGSVQRVQVASFSPESARERNQPYPAALVKLGCSILKIRNDVYGDGYVYYRKADCTDSTSVH